MSKDSNNRSTLVMALGLVALLLFSANFISYLKQTLFRTSCQNAHIVTGIHAVPARPAPVPPQEQDLDREIQYLTLELQRLNREIRIETPQRHRRSVRIRVHNAHRDARDHRQLRSTLQQDIQVELDQALAGLGCEDEVKEIVIREQR